MMRNSKKKCLLVFEKIVLFFTKSLSFYKRIVWKGVSAPPFFFHLPFFRNKQLPPPPPPFDTHRREIPDSMMIHRNQRD